MTLIIGLLGDKYACVAADTRVTIKSKDTGLPVSGSDSLFKLSWDDGVCCAVAGNRTLSTHIVNDFNINRLKGWGVDDVVEYFKNYTPAIVDSYLSEDDIVYSDISCTIIIIFVSNNIPHMVIVDVSMTSGVEVKVADRHKRYIYGQVELIESAEDDSSELDMKESKAIFGLNYARILSLVSQNKLSGVSPYVTTLRLSPSGIVEAPSGSIVPISLGNSDKLNKYSVDWSGGWPTVSSSNPESKPTDLMPFSISDKLKDDN